MQTFSLNNQLGELLKELRIKKGWSLRKASEESGVSHTYIGKIENGLHPNKEKNAKVSPEQLKKLADAYDYPYNLLMIKAGYGESTEDDPSFLDQVKHMVSTGYANVPDQIDYVHDLDFSNDEGFIKSLEEVYIREEIHGWDIPKTAGDRIKELRIKSNMTVNELSEQLASKIVKKNFMSIEKFPADRITLIENNVEDPSISFLIAASEFFDVSIDWIVKGKEYEGIKFNDYSREEAKIILDNTREKIIQELQETISKIRGDI